MVRRRSPSNSLLSLMRRLLLRMFPTMLPKRRRVRRIMAMVHIIRQRRASQRSHRIKSSPLLHRRSLRLRPTSRISSSHTTNQPANQPPAIAQASHTTTRRSPSNSQPSPRSSRQLRHPNQPTNPAHTLAQTHHSMQAPTRATASPPHNPTSHKQATTLARRMPIRSSHSALLPWLLPAQTLVQQASQTPPSR